MFCVEVNHGGGWQVLECYNSEVGAVVAQSWPSQAEAEAEASTWVDRFTSARVVPADGPLSWRED